MDKAKDLYKLQRQAKQIKKELKNIHVESNTDGLTVVFDGEQKCLDVQFSEDFIENIAKAGDAKKMKNAIMEATNKAVKKSQLIGAERMKETMGGLGGMFGQ